MVAAKATTRASKMLGLSGASLARTLGLSEPTISRLVHGDKPLAPDSKEGELAMLLVQVDTATGLPFGPVEIFEGFEDPGMPIPEVAQQVTGIRDDMVKGQRLDDAQVAALVAMADLVIAHNAGFDRPFVEARFPGFADKAWACSFADIDWKAQGRGSAKLESLAQASVTASGAKHLINIEESVMFRFLTRKLTYGLAILIGINLLTFVLFFKVALAN